MQTSPFGFTWSDWNVGPTLAIFNPVLSRQFWRELATFLCRNEEDNHFYAHILASPITMTFA